MSGGPLCCRRGFVALLLVAMLPFHAAVAAWGGFLECKSGLHLLTIDEVPDRHNRVSIVVRPLDAGNSPAAIVAEFSARVGYDGDFTFAPLEGSASGEMEPFVLKAKWADSQVLKSSIQGHESCTRFEIGRLDEDYDPPATGDFVESKPERDLKELADSYLDGAGRENADPAFLERLLSTAAGLGSSEALIMLSAEHGTHGLLPFDEKKAKAYLEQAGKRGDQVAELLLEHSVEEIGDTGRVMDADPVNGPRMVDPVFLEITGAEQGFRIFYWPSCPPNPDDAINNVLCWREIAKSDAIRSSNSQRFELRSELEAKKGVVVVVFVGERPDEEVRVGIRRHEELLRAVSVPARGAGWIGFALDFEGKTLAAPLGANQSEASRARAQRAAGEARLSFELP